MVTAIVRVSGCERGGRAAILCKVSWTIKSRSGFFTPPCGRVFGGGGGPTGGAGGGGEFPFS